MSRRSATAPRGGPSGGRRSSDAPIRLPYRWRQGWSGPDRTGWRRSRRRRGDGQDQQVGPQRQVTDESEHSEQGEEQAAEDRVDQQDAPAADAPAPEPGDQADGDTGKEGRRRRRGHREGAIDGAGDDEG